MDKVLTNIFVALLGASVFSVDAYGALDIPCSDPELRVKSVVDEGVTTIINLTLRTTDETEVFLYPPRTNKAFFALDADSGAEFNLVGFEGVKAAPASTIYPPYELIHIKLIFEKIRAAKFHLIEGKQSSREDFWSCMNVKRGRE